MRDAASFVLLVGAMQPESWRQGNRLLQAQGCTVKLIAPQFVKPYVKSNKNDAIDSEAICEAMSRPHMRFVAVKTVKQQDV